MRRFSSAFTDRVSSTRGLSRSTTRVSWPTGRRSHAFLISLTRPPTAFLCRACSPRPSRTLHRRSVNSPSRRVNTLGRCVTPPGGCADTLGRCANTPGRRVDTLGRCGNTPAGVPTFLADASTPLDGASTHAADAPIPWAAPCPGSTDHRSRQDDTSALSTGHSTLQTDASCFSDVPARLFVGAIHIPVGAPIFFVLASALRLPTPCLSSSATCFRAREPRLVLSPPTHSRESKGSRTTASSLNRPPDTTRIPPHTHNPGTSPH